MATLQKIRNKAGTLVAIVIGLALFAFILGDFLGGNGTVFQKNQWNIAEVDGKEITYMEFDNQVDQLSEIYKLNTGQNTLDENLLENIREQTWQQLLRQLIMNPEYEKLGVSVSPDELFDMVQGNNPHPIIQNLFTNPETGVINKEALFQFLRAVNNEQVPEEQKKFWLYWENEIAKERRQTKYNNLIKKGLYTTSLQAEREFKERNNNINLNYVVQRFNAVPDSAITISKKDIEKYYNDHKKDYKQDASRDLEYIVYDVIPTAEDDKAAQKWIDNIKQEFEETDDTKQFINYNSDLAYTDVNYGSGDLPQILNDVMFGAEEGFVYGPYFEDNAYKLAKLDKIIYLPDSVKARHILLKLPSQQYDYAKARSIIDSLKTMVENGADFASLAREWSEDGSAADGGDLGWFEEGQMVKQFNDTCFYGKTGDLKIVESQFGVHLVKITDQSRPTKKVQVGILQRRVEPSSHTIQNYYSKASQFAGVNNTYKKFKQAVEDDNALVKLSAPNLQESDKTISGLEKSREIIRWAFGAELGEVSKVYELEDKFVVAAVANIREKGFAPIEQKRAEIELNVRKDKKAEKIKADMASEINDEMSLEEVASKFDLSVSTASNVNMGSPIIPSAGFEPEVVAYAISLEPGKVSQPIIGTNGVFVVEVLDKTEAPEKQEYSAELQRLNNSYSSRVNYEAFETLKEDANVEDMRAKFY